MKPLLFWTEEVKKIIWDPFWWILIMAFILYVPFLRMWWWVFLPFFLFEQLKELYLWWLNWDFNYANKKWMVLEMVPPKQILTPVKAMEDIFSVLWPVLYSPPNFREIWCDGIMEHGDDWCSWEIVSLEGKIHFYVRINVSYRPAFEVAIYNHYPEIEIKEVPDFVNLFPPTVPNEEWDAYGEDWDFRREAGYPIKTYEKFFEPQGEKIQAEEKRMDPIISLLEAMTRVGKDEYYWTQFITSSVTDADEPDWKKEAQGIVAKIAKRPEKKKTTFFEDLFFSLKELALGPQQEGSGEKASYEWLPQQKEESGDRELLLTPGERDIVTAIEGKLSKPVFRTTVRGIYVAKRESWSNANKTLLRSYLPHFSSPNLNSLSFSPLTRPKIHYFMRQRRAFIRARKIFKNAVLRFPPLFPERSSEHLNPILNTEEMATLYHFPVRLSGMLAPSSEQIQSKKAGPPANLPIE